MVSALPLLIWVLWVAFLISPVVIWLLFRNRGYKRDLLDSPPGPGWKLTDERSVDLRTGAVVEVWYKPASGERAYVRAKQGI